MDYLPIFMDLRGRRCVVVGGGSTARRKVDLLLRASGSVTVAAPHLDEQLEQWAVAGRLEPRRQEFAPAFLEGAAIVVAATDDREVNRAVAREARRLGIPVNVVDDPAESTFIMPAIVDRSPLLVAISSGGAAPVLARLLKARLEQFLAHGYGRLASLAGEFRATVKQRILGSVERNRFWERVFEGPVAELMLAGHSGEAREALSAELDRPEGLAGSSGSVALVGAGPGDPELLTLRAARLLREADTLVHDRLVSSGILDMARRDAERIDVGKCAGHACLPQEQINELLVRLVRQGRRVVRLKGGDPFIFGRGGEEQEALHEAGIRCEVVPGITAASGCAARLGIPLTHRECAHSLVIATGHPREGNAPALPRVAPGQTLALYMGVSRLPEICGGLIAQGLPAETPAALIQDGTTERERVLTATLATLPELAQAQAFRAPALLIVGEVVRFGTRTEAALPLFPVTPAEAAAGFAAPRT